MITEEIKHELSTPAAEATLANIRRKSLNVDTL